MHHRCMLTCILLKKTYSELQSLYRIYDGIDYKLTTLEKNEKNLERYGRKKMDKNQKDKRNQTIKKIEYVKYTFAKSYYDPNDKNKNIPAENIVYMNTFTPLQQYYIHDEYLELYYVDDHANHVYRKKIACYHNPKSLDEYKEEQNDCLSAFSLEQFIDDECSPFALAMNEMPAPQRQLIIDIYVNKIPATEIATRESVSPPAISQRLTYAKKLLRELMKKHQ